MDIWIATGNKNKLTEFKVLLNSIPNVVIHSISELPVFSPPPEDGKTYLDNARIKAKSLKAIKSDQWVIGEDSGLEVLGLGNIPGIYSARYAGPKASDAENRTKLLKMMQIRNVTDRSAKYVCCMVIYSPKGEEWIIQTEMPGKISLKEIGQLGFGYDSIFIPQQDTKTLAELEPSFKNKYSHRALACKEFINKLQAI